MGRIKVFNKKIVETTKKKVSFTADKVRVSGPKIDGGYIISFEVGEYMKDRVAQIINLSQDEELKVTVTVDDFAP